MSHIVVDLEKGAAALFHSLDDGSVSNVAALPQDAQDAVKRFAAILGVPDPEITGDAAGWLFDLLMHATEAISGTGAAAAADTPPAAAAAVDRQPGAAAIEPGGEKAPVSQAQPTPAEAAAVAAEANQQPETPHGPADTDLPPVTEPREGQEICPKCSGFRTVLEHGAVVVCPLCHGAGEVAAGTPNQA